MKKFLILTVMLVLMAVSGVAMAEANVDDNYQEYKVVRSKTDQGNYLVAWDSKAEPQDYQPLEVFDKAGQLVAYGEIIHVSHDDPTNTYYRVVVRATSLFNEVRAGYRVEVRGNE